MSLRDYQKECISGIEKCFEDGDSTLAVLPTGTGKTHCFASLISEWDSAKGKVLVIAHRGELIWQAKDKIDFHLEQTGVYTGAGVEMGMYRTESSYGFLSSSNVVVATVQTLVRRLKNFNPREFGLVVVDEAHHSVKKNRQYWSILDYFSEGGCKVLGVTATPDRNDKEALGTVFKSVAFQYEISDAISDGWLSPVKQEMVHVHELDLSKVSVNYGDLAQGQLNDILKTEEICHRVVSPTLDIVGDRKTLVFAAGVAQADKMVDILNRHKAGSAVSCYGATRKEDRREVLSRYAKGEHQFLVGCNVFTEGYDEPTIECVVMARPTKSRMLYAQMAGRGTRVLPDVIEGAGQPPTGYDLDIENGFWRISTPEQRKDAISKSKKPSVLLIDFVGNAGRHKLIYSGDILGGSYSDEVVSLANYTMQKSERTLDVAEELLKAKEVVEAEQRKILEKIVIEAKYKTRSVDPFDVFDISSKREPNWHKRRQPSGKMINLLKKSKVPLHFDANKWWIGEAPTRKEELAGKKPRTQLTFWKAKSIIDEIMKRREKNLCTYAQARILRKYGEDTEVGFGEASSVIDEIAKRGWKPRDGAFSNTADMGNLEK